MKIKDFPMGLMTGYSLAALCIIVAENNGWAQFDHRFSGLLVVLGIVILALDSFCTLRS